MHFHVNAPHLQADKAFDQIYIYLSAFYAMQFDNFL